MKIHTGNRNTSLPIVWTGDLDDDCTAVWAGLMLRAECMNEDYWWWCIYDMENQKNVVDASYKYNHQFRSGNESRQAAEERAKHYLGMDYNLKYTQ